MIVEFSPGKHNRQKQNSINENKRSLPLLRFNMRVAKVIILQTISYPLCFSFSISSYTTTRQAAAVTPLQAILDLKPDDDSSSSLDDKLKHILDRIDVYEKKAVDAMAADAEATNEGEIADFITTEVPCLAATPLKVLPVAIKILPTKEMTGLDPFYAQLCATVSVNLYKEGKLDDFVLDQGYKLDSVGLTKVPEVILYDNNGIFECTNPSFVVVVAGTKMILGWRGSQTVMDWDRNLGFHASSSFRWKNVAKTVKVHGSYLSLVEDCLIEHEDFILKEIKTRGITELIFTGHSLGGGVAQVAHLWFEGSMNQSGVDNNIS